MLLRPSRDIDMTKPRLMLRNRVLALGCLLLSPMRSSAFLLNLDLSPTPAQQHHRIVAGSRSSSYGSAASSASTVGTARGSAGRIRCRTVRLAAAAGGSGNSSPKSEKVYKADDTIVRESDIENCRTYDECDLSPETLGTPFGEKSPVAAAAAAAASKHEEYDRSRFHVHFGAGRLGLGLVVGAIAESKTPFGVVQRPKASWGGIISHGCGAQIEITVNGKAVVEDVTVISEGCDVEEYLKVGIAAMVVVGDRPTLLQLVRKATSFSCSLGAAMAIAMIPLLEQLEDKPLEERPVLYACENDHDAVRRVGKLVASKVTTIPCMVDRICTGRQIGERERGGGYEVNVEAEPNFEGALVLLQPPRDPALVPFGGARVLIPTTENEASYFYKRKFSIVNGMHTVLGFMTLREKAPGAKELQDFDLLAYNTASPEIQAELWAWVVVRCMDLLDRYGVDVIMKAHSVDTEEAVFDILLNYGRQTLDRFSSVVDSTSRVLGGGLGNRLITRLQPMVIFMNTHKFAGERRERSDRCRGGGGGGGGGDRAAMTLRPLARRTMPFCTQDFIGAKQTKIAPRSASISAATA
ncbi:unnamed protein product, partial [Pylaiella littoralis]